MIGTCYKDRETNLKKLSLDKLETTGTSKEMIYDFKLN